jgi:hypothetical protein
VLGLSVGGEIGQDLSNHAAELVAVPREAGGDGDLRVIWVRGDDEVLVWGVGVHAGLRVDEVAVHGRDVAGEVAPDKLHLLVVDLPIYALRIGRFAVGAKERRLDAILAVDGRDAVEHVAVVRLVDPDGDPLRCVGFHAALRPEPEQELARNL